MTIRRPSRRVSHMLGGAMGLIGLGLIVRGATNVSTRKLMGLATSRPIRVNKSIHVSAPLERVYRFWRNYENFPKFMSNVHEVTEIGESQSHWVVAGPAGSRVEWDAEITQEVPNEVLAWQSLPGSTVDNAGAVRFVPENNGTRVDITLWYTPPAGGLGHAVAKLFGADPKSEMDQDLANVKQDLEATARTM